MAVDDLERLGAKRRRCRKQLQLERQALGRIAGAHARGLEALQVLEADRQLFGLERVVLGEHVGNLFER